MDEIEQLKEEVERFKKLTPEELVNKLTAYEAEINQLKAQLEQLNSQLNAQIEVKEPKKWPWKIRK